MKRLGSIFGIIIAICLMLNTYGALAADATDVPTLNAVEFNNATIDGNFNPDVHEYKATLKDNSISPTLKSYDIDWNANIFVTYQYDETNHQTGIIITLEYAAGNVIYTFTYSNPAEYKVTAECHLSSVYCTYGEVVPKINNSDTSYKLYIPSDLTELAFTPVTKDLNAYCAPINMTLAPEQEPELTLNVTASDGSVKTYKFKVKRVDKTMEMIDTERRQPDFTSFVNGTRIYQQTTFIVAVAASAGGIALFVILFLITRRVTVNVVDKEEPPFYKER